MKFARNIATLLAVLAVHVVVLFSATPPAHFTLTPGAPLLVRDDVERPDLFGATVSWTDAPAADLDFCEVGTSTSPVYEPYHVDFVGSEFDCPRTAQGVSIYKIGTGPCVVWIRSVTTGTGARSEWRMIGDVSSYLRRPVALAPLSSEDRAVIVLSLRVLAGQTVDPVRQQALADAAAFVESFVPTGR